MTDSTLTDYSSRTTSAGSGTFTLTAPSNIFKYNPHMMPPSAALETFVGREELLSEMVSWLREQRGAREPKHMFLYGGRGMGKTTMLLVLRHKIASIPGLTESFVGVQFPEEERRVTRDPERRPTR